MNKISEIWWPVSMDTWLLDKVFCQTWDSVLKMISHCSRGVVYGYGQSHIWGGAIAEEQPEVIPCACLTRSNVTGSHVTFPLTFFPRTFFHVHFSQYFFSRTFFSQTVSRTFFPVCFPSYFFPVLFSEFLFSSIFSYFFRPFFLVLVQNVGWGVLYDVRVL
jgi:hypothetical protein